MCAGLRVTFDTDISVLNTPGGINGWRHGFELWNNISGNAATGGTSAGNFNCVDPIETRNFPRLYGGWSVSNCSFF